MQGAIDLRQGVERVVAAVDRHAEPAELARDDFEIHVDIVNREDLEALKADRWGRAIRLRQQGRCQRQIKPEARADAWRAVEVDGAPHQRHELLADRQSKPGAAVATGDRIVGL